MQDPTYTEGQRLQGSDGNVYVVRNGVPTLESARPSAPQPLRVGTPDPSYPYEAERARAQAQTATAQAPYAGTIAQANAREADAKATKAERDLQAQQATASPQQQKGMADLGNDEVLAAIGRAREGVSGGGSTGLWARLSKIPGIGELVEPQGVTNLRGDLSTVASRITLDTLAKLKQTSPTGASGLGSLTEKEGALLRDSIAGLDQAQSQEKLLENLANVERHYRNVQALMAGEDYRDPKVAERYGIVPQPNADRSLADLVAGKSGDEGAGFEGNMALDKNAQYREETDPTLKGVNAKVRSMLGAGRSANDIVNYLNQIRPDLGNSVAGRVVEQVKFRAQNPKVPMSQYEIRLDSRQVPISSSGQTLNKLSQSPLGAAAISAGDAVTGFNLANLTDNAARTKAAISSIQADNPASSFAGTMTGGALGNAALEAALPGRIAMFARPAVSDAIYGGISGYGNGDGSIGDVLKGSLEGVAGGYIGRKGTQALGATARGITNPDVQALRAAEVPMTPGQMARGSGAWGDRLARREDRMTGFPGIGDTINDRRRAGMQGFNRAAFRDALEPISQTGAGNIGEQGIEEAQGAVSQAYTDALSGVNVTPDAQFATQYGNAVASGRSINRAGGEFGEYIDRRFSPFVQNPTMSGPDIQDMLQGAKTADFGTDSMGQFAQDAMGNVREALTGLVERQAPGAVPNLRAADSAYRNTSILADAVGKGMNTDGIFTPAQLGLAARGNATKYGSKMRAATTDRPFFELQRAGQNVLPSVVPDSGTAGRIAQRRGIFGAAMDGARNVVNGPLYSEALQPFITQAMLDRPEAARGIGQGIMENARWGGRAVSPLLLQYLQGGQ